MAFVLGVIFLLAAVLRFPLLNYAPPELFGDEIDVGYQAYSLLTTGKDMYGQILPTYIHSLSEWRAPLLMYATVPAIAILGNNEWGVRIPEAVYGSLTPLLLAYLVYQTSKNKSLGLWSGFFVAILPWHIHYSRAAFEVVLMLDLTLLGVIFFLKNKNLTSALLLSLALYTYSTAIVFVPLLVFSLLVLNRKLFSWRFVIASLCFTVPLLLTIVGGNASRRFNTVSVLNNKDVIDKIFTLRSGSGKVWGKLLYNRPAVVSGVVANNYLRAFSTDFLFVRGDPDYRQNLQIIGELLPTTAFFVIIGLALLVSKGQWLWVIWLVFAPIPAALTADGATHATRLFWMIPPLVVAMAGGFGWVITIITPRLRRIGVLLMLLVIFGQLVSVGYYYLHIYRLQSWRWWNVGYKDVMTKLKNESPKYDKVFINNSYEPSLERFLFWTGFSPKSFHQQFVTDKEQKDIYPGYDGFAFGDKYYFGNFNSQTLALQENSLYLISQRDNVGGDWDWRKTPPADVSVLYTSTNGFNEPIFYLVEKHDQ